MSVDYTELSQDLGKLIKYYNTFATTGQAITTTVDAILDEFEDGNLQAVVEGLRPTDELAWQAEYVARRAALAAFSDLRLTERTTMLLELGCATTDVAEALAKLIENMVAATQTINASAVSLGSVTANGANVGSGKIVLDLILDGVTSPGQRAGVTFAAHHLYRGLTTELAIAETMTFRCTADSFADGAEEGQETFSWLGRIADTQHGIATLEGSGDMDSITAIHATTETFLSNGDFETFSVANTPDDWTIDAGTVGTHIFEANGAGNFLHGARSLKLTGDGSLAAITLHQSIDETLFTAGKRYAVSMWLKASATVAAGTLAIKFTGTGYTAGTTEKISVAFGSLPTSWTLYTCFVNMPQDVPSDLALQITWSGTPTNAKSVWIDDIGIGPANFGGGLSAIAVRGATPFQRDDRFTVVVSNTEGVIQKFFRRVYGVQLPSDAAAGETIADSVAT